MKLRIAAIILIAAAGITILLSLLNLTNIIRMNHSFSIIIQIMYLGIPIALILLGISLLNNKPELVAAPSAGSTPVQGETGVVPSVGDWMLIFLVMLIPLVNIICLIIWAVDNTNKARKHYAIATIIWSVILIVITAILFATVLSSAF